MEIGTVKDQTESTEVTRPILGGEDGTNINFPITNTRMVIDSENSDKKESILTVDQSKMTFDSEISSESESGLIDTDEIMKYKSLEKSEGSKEDIEMKRDVKDAPLTLVDEDDGLMKKLGKLCGVDKQKLIDEEFEPYIKSPSSWNTSNNESQVAVLGEEIGRQNVRNAHLKQNERVGERLAFQGNDTELSSVEKQFGTLRLGDAAGSSGIKNVHNDLQPKHTNIKSVQEKQGERQPVYKKLLETHAPEVRRGSYPNQTNVQILPPPGHIMPHATHSADSDHYNFTHSQRGYLLTIVNERFARQSQRDGAHWDLLKMKEIARKFGLRSMNYNHERNLTKSETLQLLSKARRMDHSDCDCFVFMISTHGLEHKNALKRGKTDHALVCADDQLIFTSTIMEMFNDTNCPTLKGKPKIFFIQACRGEKLDHGGDVFVAYPRNEDKTCSASDEVGQDRRMRESFDVSDTRHGQDSWASGHQAVNPASNLGTGQGQTSYSRPHQIPTQSSQQPLFLVPRVQQSQQTPPRTPQYRPNMQGAPGHVVSKIYAPSPYGRTEAPSLKCDNDMLVMFAIPPGMFAWRNTSQGSWMIDYLHQVLMAYDMRRPKNFLNLLTKVSALMSRRTTNTPSNPSMHEKTAVSVIEHRLDKDIVFQQKVPVSEWIKKSKTFAL